MYYNSIFRIRTMDLTIIRRVRQYCDCEGIPWALVDDGKHPYEINFKTNRKTYLYILSCNGLREK